MCFSVISYLAVANEEGLVKQSPDHCLITAWCRHGAHVAIVTVEFFRARYDVTESEPCDKATGS